MGLWRLEKAGNRSGQGGWPRGRLGPASKVALGCPPSRRLESSICGPGPWVGSCLVPHVHLLLPRAPSLVDTGVHLLHPPARQPQPTQGLLRSRSQAKRERELLCSCMGTWAWASACVMKDIVLGRALWGAGSPVPTSCCHGRQQSSAV